MKQVTATGQTVEKAVEQALTELNTTRDKVDISIVDEGKKGIFGFGSRPAIVKVTLKIDPIEEGIKYIKSIGKHMGIHIDVEIKQDGKFVEFLLSGEKIALLIGKRGQTLNAIQYLTQLIVNRYSDQYFKVMLDAENYREKREKTLVQLAERLANKAIRTGQKISLEPMPSYERKVIHTALMDNPKIKTYSDGVEPKRHIVISPVK